MRNSVFTIFSLFLIPFLTNAQEMQADSQNSPQLDIQGEWIIDLRPSKDASPYLQSFIVNDSKDKSFSGLFYDSPLEEVILNRNWDQLYFSFITEDASNRYYHSGYFSEDGVFGITYCPSRQFTMPWTGEKTKE